MLHALTWLLGIGFVVVVVHVVVAIVVINPGNLPLKFGKNPVSNSC